MLKNLACDSWATALAFIAERGGVGNTLLGMLSPCARLTSMVLPLPGGPKRSSPLAGDRSPVNSWDEGGGGGLGGEEKEKEGERREGRFLGKRVMCSSYLRP